MIMDEYAAWDKAGRNHASGAFGTSTLRQIEEHIARINIDNSAETGCGKSTILLSNYSMHHTIFTYDDRHLGERTIIDELFSRLSIDEGESPYLRSWPDAKDSAGIYETSTI